MDIFTAPNSRFYGNVPGRSFDLSILSTERVTVEKNLADSESSRLPEDNFQEHLALNGSGKNAEYDRGTPLFHLNRRKPDIQSAGLKEKIEERKALEESARKHMSESNGKTAPASAAAEAAKSFELKPPIKRPKSASVNHAQYIAEEREKGKIVEEDPISAETRKAKAKVSAAQIEERKAIQRSETAAKKAEDALKAVEAANAALAEAEKLELEAQSAVKEVEADTLDSIHKAEVAREEANREG